MQLAARDEGNVAERDCANGTSQKPDQCMVRSMLVTHPFVCAELPGRIRSAAFNFCAMYRGAKIVRQSAAPAPAGRVGPAGGWRGPTGLPPTRWPCHGRGSGHPAPDRSPTTTTTRKHAWRWSRRLAWYHVSGSCSSGRTRVRSAARRTTESAGLYMTVGACFKLARAPTAHSGPASHPAAQLVSHAWRCFLRGSTTSRSDSRSECAEVYDRDRPRRAARWSCAACGRGAAARGSPRSRARVGSAGCAAGGRKPAARRRGGWLWRRPGSPRSRRGMMTTTASLPATPRTRSHYAHIGRWPRLPGCNLRTTGSSEADDAV